MSLSIKLENISKQYRLGDVGTGSLAHDINRSWHRMRGKEDPYLKIGEANDRATKGESNYVWALKNINFEVQQGEVMGIIGRNGAGKSTLLKILSRTTLPTTGSIKIKGRIASLLEVGTGFHPELSGRENIFLNGAIMGMTRQEIKNKFDEIVDFAGVERYIDTPVKRYSSGMYVRLAFGVAAHLEPDILIVDEVLAVGDAEFQSKALGKMKEVSGKDGRTVLFVSHDLNNILKLTTSCILLENGNISALGKPQIIVEQYLKFNNTIGQVYKNTKGSPKPYIKEIVVQTSHPNNVHHYGMPFKIAFKVDLLYSLDSALLSFQIFNYKLEPIINIRYTGGNLNGKTGEIPLECNIPFPKLYKGNYTVSAYLGDQRSQEHFESVEYICPFTVEMINADNSIWLDNVCAYLEEYNWT